MSYDKIAENLVLTIIQENEKFAMLAVSSTQDDWDICYFTQHQTLLNFYEPHYVQVKSIDYSTKNKAVKYNFSKAKLNNIEFLFIVIFNHKEKIKGPVVYKFPMVLFQPNLTGKKVRLVDPLGNIYYSAPKKGNQTFPTSTLLSDDIKKDLEKYRIR